jgi:TatD DNase family protein
MLWIDTHCHLDAPEFAGDVNEVVGRARSVGVCLQVLPAVVPAYFSAVQQLAHQHALAYALGTHPLWLHLAGEHAVQALADALVAHAADPRLVAVGEIGVDHFVPALQTPEARHAQEALYAEQLHLAHAGGWPVILHVRRSADTLLKHLRRLNAQGRGLSGGIAHAFNGSEQQAMAFVDMGFKLGFGGAMTFDRALQIRRLAQALPAEALVLETDAPDIPPHWLYRTAEQRAHDVQGNSSRNEPGELPRIAATLAELRGWSLAETAACTRANALAALPRLAALMPELDS